MREYNNRDSKTNDEESDPCIAAEVRMKKSTISPRTRRNLVALLIVLAVIAALSVLLFLILPRSKGTPKGAQPEEYVAFDVPAETSPVAVLATAATYSPQESDLFVGNVLKISPNNAVFHASENREPSSPSKERMSDTPSVLPEKATVRTGESPVLAEVDPSLTILTTGNESTSDSVPSEQPAMTLPITKPMKTEEQTAVTDGNMPTATEAHSTAQLREVSSDRMRTAETVRDTTVDRVPVEPTEESSSGEETSVVDGPDLTPVAEPQNCEEFFVRGERESGTYSVSLPKVGNFSIVCDMVTKPGGWNVIQRRQDAEVFFDNRTWNEYADGFGQLNTSFWLGLEKVYALVAKAKGKPLTLRIELRGDRCDEGDKCSRMPDGYWFGEWDFKISDAKSNYTLTLSPAKAGNISEHTTMDKFYNMNNGQQFTTVDRDNDRFKMNCAAFRNFGGWWHRDCGFAALNGRYDDTSGKMKHLFWFYFSTKRVGSRQKVVSYHIKPRFTEMKIRSRL